jgi:hypothetical protein
VGLAGLALAWTLVPQVKAEVLKPMDWPGFVLTGLGLGAMIMGFFTTVQSISTGIK